MGGTGVESVGVRRCDAVLEVVAMSVEVTNSTLGFMIRSSICVI